MTENNNRVKKCIFPERINKVVLHGNPVFKALVKCYCSNQSYLPLVYCTTVDSVVLFGLNASVCSYKVINKVCKSMMIEQTCLQVSRGRQLVQGGPADGPETSCCGQRGAGRQTALHSDSTNTQYNIHTPHTSPPLNIWTWHFHDSCLIWWCFTQRRIIVMKVKVGKYLHVWLISRNPWLSDRRHDDSKCILTAGCQTCSWLQWVFSAGRHKTSTSEKKLGTARRESHDLQLLQKWDILSSVWGTVLLQLMCMMGPSLWTSTRSRQSGENILHL